MSTFGTGFFFVCVVISFLYAVFTIGWGSVIGLFLFVLGYLWLLGVANDTFYPNGDLRPRRSKRRRK